ncbi:alpha/beta hydrolase [Propionicimonas sp.]|uniref:alpha/beta hydrolase n=1 Tax=Propionicimonas sp. TaxID=1955623 RepID=UPI0039E2167D
MNRLIVAAAACLAGLAAAGCTPGSGAELDPGSPGRADRVVAPSLVWGECPSDVEAQFVSRHECGELTVLQDRERPEGPTLSLLVLKVWPVGAEPEPGLGTSFGKDPGVPGALGGDIAAGATRAGKVSVNLSPRGTVEHAGPPLTCPEVDQITTAGVSDQDQATRAAFVSAVAGCAARLRADGAEPADFGAAANVEDIEDLRVALGEDSWNGGGSYGVESRTALNYLARYPGRVEKLILDSPAPAGLDPLTAGALGLDSALTELAGDHPGLLATWRKALGVAGRRALTGVSGGVRVTVDDARLVRLVRGALGGDGPEHVAAVPAMIAAAARGTLHPALARLATADPPFCSGYIALCRDRSRFALGLFLTDFCEQLPADRTRLDQAVAGRPAYRRAFAESPYEEACAAWDVPPAAPTTVAAGDTPALLLSGGLDSFSRPEWSADLAARLGDRAWSIAIPGHTHNVLGSSECAIALRDEWRAAPPAAPTRSC